MRIAIVNDMLVAMEALRRVVTSVPDYEIAWVARDGAEAVEKCAADTPDVILMDLIMPVMDGMVYYLPGSSQQCGLWHAQSRGGGRRRDADSVPRGNGFLVGGSFRGE
jgi:response regulator receiver domain-containing protein